VSEFIRMLKSLLAGGKPVRKSPADASAKWISNPWHAVSIVVSKIGCPSARKAAHGRFLSAEAPALPLAGCSARTCTCHYRHHQDRRHRPRRRADIIGVIARWQGAERRNRGRRATD